MTPTDTIRHLYQRIRHEGERPIWISTVPLEMMLDRLFEADPALPLYGLPFAVKDNIDVAGMPTTAGCPAYAYTPDRNAPAVDRLIAAGAILVGKTNLDQFATGLVGVRSPYGACSSVYDSRYISGGSSSGSAVAVAKGLAAFSLGTDTAGSGRVPAAFNNLIGLKPTRGGFSMEGIVPACRSLDCVSVFAGNCDLARRVWNVLWSRPRTPGENAAPWLAGRFRFGVPAADQLRFFGDDAAAELYSRAITRAESLGGERVEIDFSPFRAAADLLYSGPWVAERLAAIQPFLEKHAERVHPVVRQIIAGGAKYTAVDAYRAAYRLDDLILQAEREWSRMDVLLLPTAGTIYTIAEVEADPIVLNTNLGYYTNFVNLMNLAAVAAPAGFRPNGLPFGVSFIGRAFSDEALLNLAGRFLGEVVPSGLPGCVQVAVVGAHLTGQPLNHELISRGAHLIRATRTDRAYRLYALRDTRPPKPGLVYDESFSGPGLEVEIWAMPEHQFGGFVASIPPPLGIGTVRLENKEWVQCFICEPYAVHGSNEITNFGGWRAYRASLGY
ncbi:MAG: allophanate hydrolase [Bryobacteraceae bacterium]|nr:allophanate hydrolase [Bryobacteraceae bacterium]